MMKLLAWLLVGLPFFIACNNAQNATENKNKAMFTKDSVSNIQILPSDSNSIVFSKKLNLQGITYEIISMGKGSIQKLTVIPSGLKLYNDTITQEVDPIVGAEIEDLDTDGFPELLIYTQSAGTGSYGNVIGFSPNKGKSLSQIYFPTLEKKSASLNGYMGHDEFAIVENTLVRRFKVYNNSDVHAKSTGYLRQLEYKLIIGEASKKFKLIKLSEIPAF